MQLTPWFPGDLKPVRVGVYERKYDTTQTAYCHFDGQNWRFGTTSLHFASDAASKRLSNAQNLPWRGVMK